MSLEEQYDEVRQLIELGKEKGYLLYDEVNELLPADITTSDALDELFTAFDHAGESSPFLVETLYGSCLLMRLASPTWSSRSLVLASMHHEVWAGGGNP